MAIGMSSNASSYMALSPEERKKRIQGVTGYTPPATVTSTTGAYNSNPVPAASPIGYTPPAYGSNVQGFDPNNAQHKQLADAGMSYATAKASGDQAGMQSASAMGNQIRSGIQGASYDSVKGISTLPVPQPPNQPVSTPDKGLYTDPYARTPESINTLAKARMDEILQAGKTSAQGALTGARNAYDYTNQIEGDTRTLRNFDFKNRNDPFSGQTGDMAFRMQREDNIQDTAQDKDYNAQVGMINQKLADLQAAAPAQQQQIIDDLQQIERQTGIDVAQLQMQQKEQQFNQGMVNKQFDRSNFESDRSYDFAKGQQEWENNFKSGQFDLQKAQQIWDNTFQNKSFQQSMNEAAASRGLQWASLSQRDKEFLADQEFKKNQFQWSKDMDIANTWQKTREMDLAEKKLNTTEKATYNEAMQKAIDSALKDPAYVSAKDDVAKNAIIDSYYNKLTSGIGMADSEIEQYLK